MKRILYFDCFAGISGDMTVGALLDLGIDPQTFLSELAKLNLEGYQIEISPSIKNGITGIDFKVNLEETHHVHEADHHKHRNLYDIEKLIDNSMLENTVKERSKKIFRLVTEAEAKVHGKPVHEIHFHEVGAIDSIIDIVGTSICIDLLEVDEIYCSPLHVGSGFVECAHGIIPVPAPATLEIVKNVPIYNDGVKAELVTPTGAAIVKGLSSHFGDMPSMEIQKIGYGLGKKQLKIPNMLRVYLAKKKASISL